MNIQKKVPAKKVPAKKAPAAYAVGQYKSKDPELGDLDDRALGVAIDTATEAATASVSEAVLRLSWTLENKGKETMAERLIEIASGIRNSNYNYFRDALQRKTGPIQAFLAKGDLGLKLEKTNFRPSEGTKEEWGSKKVEIAGVSFPITVTAGKKKVEKLPSGGGQPSDSQPTGGQPSDSQPSDSQPSDSQPDEDVPLTPLEVENNKLIASSEVLLAFASALCTLTDADLESAGELILQELDRRKKEHKKNTA